MFEAPLSRVDMTPVAYVPSGEMSDGMASLVGYLRSIWDRAERHRSSLQLTAQMFEQECAARSRYTPDAEVLIAKAGQEPVFYPMTEARVLLAHSWLMDVFGGSTGERTWELRFTPDAKLPIEVEREVLRRAADEALAMGGGEGTYSSLVAAARSVAWAEQRRALERAERVLRDLLEEGNWASAFQEFLRDLLTYDAAFLKGPILRKRAVQEWSSGKLVTRIRRVPWFYCVNPMDLYTSPDAGSLQEGDLIEVVRLTPAELKDLRGEEGVLTDQLDALLKSAPLGSGSLAQDSLRERLEGRSSGETSPAPRLMDSTEPLRCLDIWTRVPGFLLKGAGYDWAEEDASYPVEALMTLSDWRLLRLLRVEGNRPYVGCSWQPRPGSVWGRGLVSLLSSLQKLANALCRAMAMNAALAGGAQILIHDTSRLGPGVTFSSIEPLRVWPFTNPRMMTSTPMEIVQLELRVPAYMEALAVLESLADSICGFSPPQRMNEGRISGRSAAGAAIVLSAAGRVLRRVVSALDQQVVRPALQALYRLAVKDVRKEELKGLALDVEVAPRGALALAVADVTLGDKLALLQILGNETMSRVLGPAAVSRLTYLVARGVLGEPAEEVLPSPDEIRMRAQQMDAMEQQQLAAATASAETDAQLQMAKLQLALQEAQARMYTQQQMVAIRMQDLQRRIAETQAKVQDREARQQLAQLQIQIQAMEAQAKQQLDAARLQLDAARLGLEAQQAQSAAQLGAARLGAERDLRMAELALSAEKLRSQREVDAARLQMEALRGQQEAALRESEMAMRMTSTGGAS